MATTTIYYNTAGANNWQAYWGVDLINVEMWGAGGAGANRNSNGQGGGGKGGAYSRNNNFAPTAGILYSLEVGLRGNQANNSNGTNSSFNNGTVLAEGGATAGRNNATGQTAGGSAANSVGEVKYSGGNGVTGNATIFGGGGGSSAGNAGAGRDGQGNVGGGNGTDSANLPAGAGAGGNGAKTGSAVGTAGVAPGGAGGGASRNSATNRAGGNGANGRVVISYTTPLTEKLADDFTGVTAADASQLSTGSNFGFGQWSAVRYRGQRFTPTHSGNITKIGFSRNKGTQGIKVYIDTITSNAPTHAVGSELYSFTITNANVIDEYGEYDLPTPLAVTGGVEYCFYLAPWDTSGNAYSDDYQDLRGISSGAEITNNNGSWSTENLAFYFNVYITNTINPAKWSNWGGANVKINNGQIEITTDTTASYYGAESLGIYDLTGSYAMVKLVNAGSQVTDFTAAAIDLTLDTNNSIGFIVNGGSLVAQKHIAGAYTEVTSTTYNSAIHKYLKIRESGGTVYWDYSTDGLSWINLGSFAVASLFAITGLLQGFSAGCDSAGISASTVILDDFNIKMVSVIEGLLEDNFDDGTFNTSLFDKFETNSATVTEGSGRLTMTPASSTAGSSGGIYTDLYYDFTGKYWGTKVSQTCSGTLAETHLMVKKDGNNYLRISKAGGDTTLYCHKIVAGTWTQVATVTYNATTMLYWRIRESSGTIYFEYSADKVTWTAIGSTANPFVVTSMYPQISVYADNVASAGSAYFDEIFSDILFPSGSDAISKSEVGGSTPIDIADSGAGSDAGSILGLLGLTDTGAGSDAPSILGLIPVADSGSGSDALALLALLSIIDSYWGDTFDDGTLDTTVRWMAWGGVPPTEGSGNLQIPSQLSPAYCGVDARVARDFTGHKFWCDLADAGNQALASWGVYFQLSQDANNAVYISVENGSLVARQKVAGVQTLLNSITYNATNHRYLQLRESSGTIYFEYSADRVSWSTLATLTTPYPITITSVYLEVIGGTWQAEGSTTTALVNEVGTDYLVNVGTDGVALTSLIGIPDTMSGSDVLSILGLIPVTDSSSGSELLSILATISVDDSGSGVDVASAGNSIEVSDSGSAVDALALLALIGISDSSQGSEALNILATIAVSDSGSASDALAILALVAVSDSGSAVDAVSLLALIAMSDSGSANEALAILALLSVTDTSVGVEALNILNNLSVDDSGVGADVASILALLEVNDTAVGTESIDLLNFIYVDDAGTFNEVIDALKVIMVSDTSTADENILVIVRQALSMIRNVIAQRGRGTMLRQKGIETVSRQRSTQNTLSQTSQSVILKQRK